MSPSQRKVAIILLGVSLLGLEAARIGVPGGVPVGFAFALAAIALFRFGYSLQHHAVATLRRFRVTPRTIVWFAAVVAFWFSTAVWVWWSRRTPNFPLYLLDGDLEPKYFFDAVPALVILGLALEVREN